MHNIDHNHHKPMKKIPPIEGFQLLMSHLFNVCNKTKVFPITKATAVLVTMKDEDGNEYEVNLQDVLDNLQINDKPIIVPDSGENGDDITEPDDVNGGNYGINDKPNSNNPTTSIDLQWSNGKVTYTLTNNGDTIATRNGSEDGELKVVKTTKSFAWSDGSTRYRLSGNGSTIATYSGQADGVLTVTKN